ncbi:MAG TPA: histidine utilization repressor [Pyrinomonadaceae bacterium]|nr:histidine utilization repressor [Pyrinomonadaceae bacterium]
MPASSESARATQARRKSPQPSYDHVKSYVLQKIQSGAWADGERIPSENQLVKRFGLSRMTINRALRELTDEEVLHRIQGAGTFVSLKKYQSTVVKIRSLGVEIAERGHVHRANVLVHERIFDKEMRARFKRTGGELFHSIIIHYENDDAIQLEDRYVNPDIFPEYIEQDFTRQTPNEYLTTVAPIERVEFRIEAIMPDAATAERLTMQRNEPCLVLNRRTWSFGKVASVAALWHPSSRFQFSGSF